MIARDFEQLFRADVRVIINWSAVRKHSPEIAYNPILSRSDLRKLRVPWYRDGKQLSIVQAATLGYSNAASRSQVFELAARFSREPPALVLPAATFDKHVVLLDGVHRSIAMYLSHAQPRILLTVMQVPERLRPAFFDGYKL